MPFPETFYLPSYEEVTIPEIKLTFPALKAASLQMGKYCDNASKEFMLCKTENGRDPRPCLNEGKEVTRCGIEFLQKVKKNCADSFTDYWRCIDTSSSMEFKSCRNYQKLFDNCVEEKLGQTRPDMQHFLKIRLHETSRPKPAEKELPEPLPVYDAAERTPRTKFYNQHGFSR
ncbi:NADH dehydrogenase [ubiquinone] 1 alpha subcomplex subunit 8-like [Mercenaria mercenaria]|uniref:NADH dehydrogenase [ubiquinone] 1 alpha subcomplex subunit 8-like n=1 Tax=Mercenaria mercenaria TaxID=6596 RepID=UPI00234E7863|nr:NADH dehydrogenase [ubiquinone] 1 alpha subcomplex subunit 8-like [Mercenaria mercenaria]